MVLQLDRVQKHYPKFDLDCSLTLQPGCVTGLIGQNGAGKSTTFKAILDLIRIDGGKIEVFGKDHRELGPVDRENIGVVLSDAGFSGFLTVKQIIPILKQFYHAFDKEDFLATCSRFGLPLDKKLKEFSTGMYAKLKLSVAMCHGAKLLILDEPTSGLDVMARQELLDTLRRYMENEENSILISSHISGDLEHFCDDIYMIHDGKIQMHEETNVILDEYGVLKVSERDYESLDKQYLLRVTKENYGYCCLTGEKQFYQENYPQIVIEKGSIDEVLTMMVKGAQL